VQNFYFTIKKKYWSEHFITICVLSYMKGKCVVIGDLHGLGTWESILNNENPSKVVFLGDYFDSFDIDINQQIENFNNIFVWKNSHPDVEVVTLIGNHDIHYFHYINDASTSGFKYAHKFLISHLLSEHSNELKVAHQDGKWLFTHAGVSLDFLKIFIPNWNVETLSDDLNELFEFKPNSFLFSRINNYFSDPYGDDVFQTPLWIRPKSLMLSNKNSKLKKQLIQVVGHTNQSTIDMGKSTGCRYFFVDTMPVGEYLTIEDNVPKRNKL